MTEQPDRDTHPMPRPVAALQQALQRGMLTKHDEVAILADAQMALRKLAQPPTSARRRAVGARWKAALRRWAWGVCSGVVALAVVAWPFILFGWSWMSGLLVLMTLLSVVMLAGAGLRYLDRHDDEVLHRFWRQQKREQKRQQKEPRVTHVHLGRNVTAVSAEDTASRRRSTRGR